MSIAKVPEARTFPKGLTVPELRALLARWPDCDAYGEPNEVFVETGLGVSSQVTAIWPLNRREENGKQWADMWIASDAFEKNSEG